MKENYIHKTACVDEGAHIGNRTKVWHFSHIRDSAFIGDYCHIGQNCYVDVNVRIGNGVKLQNNVSVYECVELEDYVFCGPSMVFTNDLTPRSKYPKGTLGYKKTLVKYSATIGANATIVCGHTLGKFCIIAAGAVVTKDVPDYALMSGIPAIQVGWVCQCGESLPKDKICLSCGKRYIFDKNKNLYKEDE